MQTSPAAPATPLPGGAAARELKAPRLGDGGGGGGGGANVDTGGDLTDLSCMLSPGGASATSPAADPEASSRP